MPWASSLEYLVRASATVIGKIPNVKFVIRAHSSQEKYRRYIDGLILLGTIYLATVERNDGREEALE
jgi:hypothetical protein